MESKKISLSQNSLIYGLILGIALILFDLIFYILDAPFNSPFKYLNILIITGVVIYGTITYRNKYNNGYIKYGRSFLSGFLIALFAGIVFALYEYLFVKFFDPSIIEKIIEFTRQKMMEKSGMDEEKVDKIIEMQKIFYSPAFFAVSAIINLSFWGAIISLISSIFTKKEDKSFESAVNID